MEQEFNMKTVVYSYVQQHGSELEMSLIFWNKDGKLLLLLYGGHEVSSQRNSDEVFDLSCLSLEGFVFFVEVAELEFEDFVAQEVSCRF